MSGRHARSDSSQVHTGVWARVVVCVIGACYIALGVAGLASGPGKVLVFSSGLLLDLVRTAVGLLCLTALRGRMSATALGWFLFVGFTALFAYGVPAAIAANPIDVDRVFPISWADNILHVVTAFVGLFVGLSRYRLREIFGSGD